MLTGEGSDEFLGGNAHFRRDMLLYNKEGQDPTDVAKILDGLERLNPVSRGLLLPDGEAKPLDNVKRILGFVPSWIETFSARSAKMQKLLAEVFWSTYGERAGYQALLSSISVALMSAGS